MEQSIVLLVDTSWYFKLLPMLRCKLSHYVFILYTWNQSSFLTIYNEMDSIFYIKVSPTLTFPHNVYYLFGDLLIEPDPSAFHNSCKSIPIASLHTWWAITQLAHRREAQEKQLATAWDPEDLQAVQEGGGETLVVHGTETGSWTRDRSWCR